MKNKIRKSLLEQGQLLSDDSILDKNIKIQSSAIDNIDIRSSKNILLYFPYKKEITLDILIKEIGRHRNNIYMPKLISDIQMKFNFFDKNNLFTKNKYGITEIDNENYLDPVSFDLMFIPFVGVDNAGFRLGYGGGYFDRALEGLNKNKPILIGLGYDYQVSEKSFGEPHDIRYDIVITENNIHRFK